jgi:hypothetical protein
MRLPEFIKPNPPDPPTSAELRASAARDAAVGLAREHVTARGGIWGADEAAYGDDWMWRRSRYWRVLSRCSLGTLWARVDLKRGRIISWGLTPVLRDENGWLLPLWLTSPNATAVSSYWRQVGENQKYRWHAFWRSLSSEQKCMYRARYPEPTADVLAWQGFYDQIAEVPAEAGSIADFVVNRV